MFAGAKQNECHRVKLEPKGAGTENLFGVDQVEYERSSHNVMIDPRNQKLPKRYSYKQVPAKD